MDEIILIWKWQALFLLTVMTLVTFMANRWKNAGLVDIAWAFGFSVLALIAFVWGEGDSLRRAVFSAIVCAASLRLTNHLLTRFCKEFPKEDGRYHAMREHWQEKWPGWKVDLAFAAVFYFQGLLMWVLGLSFAWVCQNASPALLPIEWAALLIWLIGFVGESVADYQLKTFLADPKNKGVPCQRGLWRYSRHPNYFFQWVMWLAYGIFACATPNGWIFLYAPSLMLYLLTCVSGVAATERESLKNRGNAYRRYQETTSPFFPAIPRKRERISQ